MALYTAEQMITALEATRGNKSAASRRLGCGRNTIERYIRNYPSVKAAYEEQREVFIDSAETALMKKVNEGDTTAIIFALKTIGRHRGYVERFEVMLEQELDVMIGVLEESLEPDEFRKVAGILAAVSEKA